MNTDNLINHLFIGKVADKLGVQQTTDLLKEATKAIEDIAKHHKNKTLSDLQLTTLGFVLKPIVYEEDFSYRIAEIQKTNSFIEVVNEYRNGELAKQFINYQVVETGSPIVSTDFLKKLQQIIS